MAYEYFDFSSLRDEDEKKKIEIKPENHVETKSPVVKSILLDNILEDKNILSKIGNLQNFEERLKEVKLVIVPKYLYDRDLVARGELSFSEIEDDFDDDAIVAKKEFKHRTNSDLSYDTFFKLVLVNDVDFDTVAKVIRREMYKLKEVLLFVSEADQYRKFKEIGINVGMIAANYHLDKYLSESKNGADRNFNDLKVKDYVDEIRDNIDFALRESIPLVISRFEEFVNFYSGEENLYRVFDERFLMKSLSSLKTIKDYNLRHESISLFLFNVEDELYVFKHKRKLNNLIIPVPNHIDFNHMEGYIEKKLGFKINLKKLGNVIFDDYEKVFYLYLGYCDNDPHMDSGEFKAFSKIRELMLTSPDTFTRSFFKSLEIYKKMNIDN